MVKNLKEFLLRPGRAGLRTQIIQNEQRRVADVIKAFIVSRAAVGPVSGAQIVQQVRNYHKKRRRVLRHALIGNGYGQVRFAAAVAPQKHQPPCWIFGKTLSSVVGSSQSDLPHIINARHSGGESVKGVVSQRLQIANRAKLLQFFAFHSLKPALAGDEFTKIGMLDGQVLTQKTCAAADWADRAGFGRRFSAG